MEPLDLEQHQWLLLYPSIHQERKTFGQELDRRARELNTSLRKTGAANDGGHQGTPIMYGRMQSTDGAPSTWVPNAPYEHVTAEQRLGLRRTCPPRRVPPAEWARTQAFMVGHLAEQWPKGEPYGVYLRRLRRRIAREYLDLLYPGFDRARAEAARERRAEPKHDIAETNSAEQEALANVTTENVLAMLPPDWAALVELVMEGHSYEEAGRALGKNRAWGSRTMAKIRRDPAITNVLRMRGASVTQKRAVQGVQAAPQRIIHEHRQTVEATVRIVDGRTELLVDDWRRQIEEDLPGELQSLIEGR